MKFDVRKFTIKEAAKLLEKGEISAQELTEAFYDVIDAADESVGAYISLNKKEAFKQSEKYANGNKGTLAGIPMAVKDNMCINGMKTTCGSRMLEGFKPPYTATAVQRLIDEGAVILGKLNMDEFAMGGSTENSYFKNTRNPWNNDMVPGGSSGGSAAAVASGQAVYALGSDTGGSIRQPAAFCGVVGMKPTYGTVSRYGLVAFASSLDQIGPITKTVEDSAIVLNAISGKDPMDSTSVDTGITDYTYGISEDPAGMKACIPVQYLAGGISPDVKKRIEEAIDFYEKSGVTVEEVELKLADYAIAAYYIISSAEASSNLARYDGIKYGFRSENFSNLSELYSNTRTEGFGDEVKRRIMLGTYALSSGYYDAYYKKALKVRTLIKQEFDGLFRKYDFILGPTAPTTAYRIGEKAENPLEMYLGDVFTVSVNIAGLPAVSVPCGLDSKGLPVGLQLIGKAYDERTILRAANAYQSQNPLHLPFEEVSHEI